MVVVGVEVVVGVGVGVVVGVEVEVGVEVGVEVEVGVGVEVEVELNRAARRVVTGNFAGRRAWEIKNCWTGLIRRRDSM